MRRVVAVLALAFFFAPVALRAVGVTARAFENRPLATLPKPAQGWDALEQGRRFFVDRMPLREQAVRADAWISTDVFDTSPSAGRPGAKGPVALPAKPPPKPAAAAPAPVDKAVAGKSGWLFLDGELSRACYPFMPWPGAIARWERLAAIIRRSGRRVVLVFPPDKSTIHPEYLPDSYPQRGCAPAGHRAAWRAIERARDPAVLGLRRLMLAAKRPAGVGPYYRLDSHWNSVGGTIAARALLERLGGPVRVLPSEIFATRKRHRGDLTVLDGNLRFEDAPKWTIRRPFAAPRIEGHTLFVEDSYGSAIERVLQAYARSLVSIEWFDTPPADLIAAIQRADTVILETVERELTFRASDLGLLTPKFLAAVKRGLSRRS